MFQNPGRAATTLITAAATVSLLTAGVASAAAAPAWAVAHPRVFHARAILNGATLHHRFQQAGSKAWRTEKLSLPDDITALGPAARPRSGTR